jgi:hypothetical protein
MICESFVRRWTRRAGLAIGMTIVMASFRCTYAVAGTEVAIVFDHVAAGTLETADGQRVEIDRAAVVFSWVELVPCMGAESAETLLLATASAHDVVLPRLLDTPYVERLEPSGPAMMGTLSPPAGRYCSARISIAPSAAGTPSIDLRVRDASGLEVAITGEVTRRQEYSFASPLVVDERTRTVELVVTSCPSRWLEGVDATDPDATAIADAALATLVVTHRPL